jgi:hypothetical protein
VRRSEKRSQLYAIESNQLNAMESIGLISGHNNKSLMQVRAHLVYH